MDKLQALAEIGVTNFQSLGAPPAEVASLLALRRLGTDALLFAQGAPTPALYAVLSGEIAVRLLGPQGETSLLEHVLAPRLFGLSSFASGLPSRYEARATRPTQLLAIGPAAYALLMDGWPGFARALLGELARRYDGTLHLLESARHRPATERLQLALQQLRRERGEISRDGWRVAATQAELAQLAGVTRQTANAWLRAQGVRAVQRDGRRWLQG